MNNLSARFLYATAGILMLVSAAVVAAPQKDVMLVLDNSGSMRKNDPTFQARGAVEAFINKLDTDSRAGVLIFDHGVKQAVPLTVVDEDGKATLIKSLENINYRGQLTDSPAAVERAIYELKTNARDGAEQYIVFMTDGIVDTGKPEADIEKTKWLREELAVDAADNGIKVFAIAFTEHADFFLIQSLAKKTNGEYFRALTPADFVGVFEIVHGILNEPPAPPPIAVEPPSMTPSSGTVITPMPDDTVSSQPLAPPASPEELLASLSPDERQALEEIAEQTGIPMEQLVLELVGPEPEPGGVGTFPEPGGAIITYPDDEMTVEEERFGIVILAVSAALLLLLVVFIVWFIRRRRNSPSAAAGVAAAATPDAPAVPEAFINDVNGYTGDLSIQLGDKPMMVGRVAGTDTQHLDYLVVNKGTVGRRHAVIKYKDFSFWLVDQGSVNGTFVNGERISGEQQLKHGDKIRFHKYDFDFSQPEMDDGFHTVFADPNAADATIVASASALASTSAMELAASIDEQSGVEGAQPSASIEGGTDDMFGSEPDVADLAASGESASEGFADAAAFADADIFDITGETELSKPAEQAATGASGDDTLEEATAIFEAPLIEENEIGAELDEDLGVEINLDATGDTSEDDEDLGVEINLDTLGEEGHSNLILDAPLIPPNEDFDADASAFFEDIAVWPTPDDDLFDPTPDEDDQDFLDAKLDQATAILGNASSDAGSKGADDPNDLALDAFIQTDSFDAPATIPPTNPKAAASDDAGDVTLDAFMSTSMFEITNEDETVLPEHVPDDPVAPGDMPAGDTVVLPSSPLNKKSTMTNPKTQLS